MTYDSNPYTSPQAAVEAPVSELPLSPRGPLFSQYATFVFLGPLILYMLVPMVLPSSPPGEHLTDEHFAKAQQQYESTFLWMWTIRAALLVPLVAFLAASLQLPRLRISWLSIVVGIIGVVLWVGVDALGIRAWASGLLGEESTIGGFLFPPRDAINPADLYGAGSARYWWFLIARFTGLALIVPIVEELMLRGWLMRMVDPPPTGGVAFWHIPFGEVSLRAAAIGIGFEVLIHPEKLAAVVWFSLTTWLMFKTKNFWDCVAAHAVTNFLLGVWVMWQGEWELW